MAIKQRRKSDSERLLIGGTVLLLFLYGYGRIGDQDYQDARAEEAYSCRMVAKKIWPEYQTRNYRCAEPTKGETDE